MAIYHAFKYLKYDILTLFSLLLNFRNLLLIPFSFIKLSRERLEYAFIFFLGLCSLVEGLMRYSVDTRESFFSISIWLWCFVSMRLNIIETCIFIGGKLRIKNYWNYYENNSESCMITSYLHCCHNYVLIFWRKNYFILKNIYLFASKLLNLIEHSLFLLGISCEILSSAAWHNGMIFLFLLGHPQHVMTFIFHKMLCTINH